MNKTTMHTLLYTYHLPTNTYMHPQTHPQTHTCTHPQTHEHKHFGPPSACEWPCRRLRVGGRPAAWRQRELSTRRRKNHRTSFALLLPIRFMLSLIVRTLPDRPWCLPPSLPPSGSRSLHEYLHDDSPRRICLPQLPVSLLFHPGFSSSPRNLTNFLCFAS